MSKKFFIVVEPNTTLIAHIINSLEENVINIKIPEGIYYLYEKNEDDFFYHAIFESKEVLIKKFIIDKHYSKILIK